MTNGQEYFWGFTIVILRVPDIFSDYDSMLFQILDMNTDFQKQTLPGVILIKLFTSQMVN